MATAKVTKFSDELRIFVSDLFDYIMTKHKFRCAYIDKQFAERLSNRFLDTDEEKCSPFTEEIGRAVLTSQYLLRGLCKDLFNIYTKNLTHCKKSFIYCVNLTHHVCVEFRSSVFWKFIDICAIVCEAFLFCDFIRKPVIEVQEAIDMLIGFLDFHASQEFISKGSWQKLKATAEEEYSATHDSLKDYINQRNVPYVPVIYDCSLIRALRKSPVPFPIHTYWFCNNCVEEADAEFCHTFNPNLTIEEFILQYGLQEPPWDDDEEDSVQEEGSSRPSSTTLEMAYIFIGADRETTMKRPQREKKKASKKKRKNKKSRKAESEPSTSQET